MPRQERKLILIAYLYLALRLVTGIASRAPNFRHSTSSPPSIRHSSLGDYACRTRRGYRTPLFRSEDARLMMLHQYLSVHRGFLSLPYSVSLSLSLSFSLSFFLSLFLSLFLFSLAHYRALC